VDLTKIDGQLVSFRSTWVFASDGHTLTSDSALRFRERDEVLRPPTPCWLAGKFQPQAHEVFVLRRGIGPRCTGGHLLGQSREVVAQEGYQAIWLGGPIWSRSMLQVAHEAGSPAHAARVGDGGGDGDLGSDVFVCHQCPGSLGRGIWPTVPLASTVLVIRILLHQPPRILSTISEEIRRTSSS
jgi:hypothetical protein